MTNWKEYKLSDIAELRREGFMPNKEIILPYIGLEHIEPESFQLNGISTSSNVTSQKYKFYPDDILYGKLRPYFKKVYAPKFEGVCSTDIYVIKSKKEVIPKYLFYIISTNEFTAFANLGSTGTRMPRADWKHLSDTVWNIPDIDSQREIAEILSSLDDKIELNKKINQELETLAQAIFKQWFIDFEFPNDEGQPYKSSGGEMVESELGEIPKGWNVVKIGSLNPNLETGKRPKGGVNGIEYGVPSVGAESIKGVGYFDFSKTKYVSLEYANSMNRGLIKGFELLIYKDGGKPGTFIPHFSMFGEGFPFEDFVINEHVFSLDFLNQEYNSFCYFFFDSQYVKPVLENSGGKAAIPGINQSDINNLVVFSPKITQIILFGEIAKTTISSILKNCKENIYLSKMRDTLLPKLLSGELEVTELKEQIVII